MVDNLLDTTRLEEGRHTLAAETIGVKPAVESIVASFTERAARHRIEIGVDAPDGLELSLDRTAFDTMLRNVIDNAVKACIAGNGKRIDIKVSRQDDTVAVAVTDDGLGFPPEDAELMFEKFYRLGDELRRKTPGTGLGLYIVKRLAELSGAKVTAASPGPKAGATVTIRWPLAKNPRPDQ
ncbi:MAG: HAMP domain-containing sensor histidine kinase, partial [Gammaproteobacteria bacterium]|nr:HAMP domain-containing sensor histidine kinase [Gammaproteobacteria bacterium]